MTPRLVAAALILAAAPAPAADPCWVFFGTYTGKASKGIYRSEFDPATGKLSEPELVAETPSPSFLAIHPTHKFLYAVGEYGEYKGKKAGGVLAYALDAKTGALTFLDGQPSGGQGPCHVTVDKAGKTVLVANYGSGSVASYPVGADGKLRPAASEIQHEGSSVDPGRQKEPHAHSINVDPSGKRSPSPPTSASTSCSSTSSIPPRARIAPNDPAFAKVRRRGRPAPLRLPPGQAVRLRHQRNEDDPDAPSTGTPRRAR